MTIREDRFGNAVQASRPQTSQAFAISAAPQLSVPFAVNQDRPSRLDDGTLQTAITQNNHTRHIRCVGTVAAWIALGTNPVAALRAPTSMYMPAGLPEYFWVVAGEQLSVVADSTSGFFYVTELTN